MCSLPASCLPVCFRSVILDDDLPDVILPDQPVTYTFLEKGSKRGGRLLVSSDGYTYGVKVRSLQ